MLARAIFLSLLVLAVLGGGWATAQTNIPAPTLGGKQIWSDVHALSHWRIQKNVITGHYRLLDGDDWRKAWGTYEDCVLELNRAKREDGLKFTDTHLVIFVHGLGRAADMFDDFEKELNQAGFQTLAITYPSTRQGVEAHADDLELLVQNLDGIENVSFVTHSMGALVVRTLLGRDSAQALPINFKRLVMIAPPNQGSAIARILKENKLYSWLTTETGQDLTPARAQALPIPDIDFAIIAGGLNDGDGYVPFVEGDDDGVVSVEETKLKGERAFRIVPAPHGLIDNHSLTRTATISFLSRGGF